jgi:hypothetical protein
MSVLGQLQPHRSRAAAAALPPNNGHEGARSARPLWADFVVEVGLEGRVGWADDFLRSRQGQRFAPARYGAAALMHWKL